MIVTKSQAFLAVIIAIVGFLSISPVALVICGSFSPNIGECGPFSLQSYVTAFSTHVIQDALYNTAIVALLSATLSVGVAILVAWIVARTNTPLKNLFWMLSTTPLFFPLLLIAIIWGELLNPVNGFLNQVMHTSFNINSLVGISFVNTLYFFPLAFLMIVASFSSMDASLEDSARLCGASSWRTTLGITLALATPAVLAAWLFNLLRAIEIFETPLILGLPGRLVLLPTLIYEETSVITPPDNSLAAATGVVQLILTFTVVFLYRWMTKRSERYVTVTGRGSQFSVRDIGRKKYAASLIAVLLLVFVLVIPLFFLVLGSLEPYFITPTWATLKTLSLNNFRTALSIPSDITAITNGLILSSVGATIILLSSTVISYIGVKTNLRGKMLITDLVFVAFAVPGIVLGLGVLWIYVRTPLYATLFILLVGYVTRYLPYGVWSMEGAMLQIHNDLEEVARTCGGGFLRNMKDIYLPLVKQSFLSGWVLVFSFIYGALAVPILLVVPSTTIVSVQILGLYGDGFTTTVMAYGLVVIGISVVVAFLLSRIAGLGFSPFLRRARES